MNTLTRLAISNNKKNKSRSVLIIISIFLSTLLLMVIASLGYGIIKSSHTNADKLYGGYAGSYRGVTENTLNNMKLRNEFSKIGSSAFTGMVDNEATLNLYWADETAFDLNNMMELLQQGTFPQKENEIAGQVAFFEKLGYKNPKVGDSISLGYRTDRASKFTQKKFMITGLLKENKINDLKDMYVGYVSEELYRKLIPKEESVYTVYFTLNSSVSINFETAEEVLKELANKCGIEEKNVFVNSYYIMWAMDPGTEIILVCVIMAVTVILFSAIVIYNIFQVGITYKIQEYGKIKALGATKKQLRKVVFREGFSLAAIGIPLGIIGGYLISNSSFQWFMNLSDDLREGSKLDQVSIFSIYIILLVSFLSVVTVWLALKRPMRIVSSISEVESMRYQEYKGKMKGYRKGKTKVGVKEITFANIFGNRRRTISTICTMGLSCVLYVVLSNLAGNFDEAYEARRTIEYGQFYISLDYSLNDLAYPENNLDNILKDNPITPELLEQIRHSEGVTEVKTRNILAIRVKSEEEKESEQLMSVSVLNKKDFEKHYNSGAALGNADYNKAAQEDAIIFGWSHFLADYGYTLNQTVIAEIEAEKQTIAFEGPLQAAFGSLETDWAITEETYKKLEIDGNMTGFMWVDCEKKNIPMVRKNLLNLLSEIDHVELSEYKDALKMTQYGTLLMKLGIYSFLAMIGLIGFMNMANTMIASIVTRKKEFGVLQAIGLTNAQLNLILQLDGLFFTIGTVVIALVVGLPVGYQLFLYGKNHTIIGINEYHFPMIELGIMITVIALLQIILSFILSRNIKKESLIDRIRYQE